MILKDTCNSSLKEYNDICRYYLLERNGSDIGQQWNALCVLVNGMFCFNKSLFLNESVKWLHFNTRLSTNSLNIFVVHLNSSISVQGVRRNVIGWPSEQNVPFTKWVSVLSKLKKNELEFHLCQSVVKSTSFVLWMIWSDSEKMKHLDHEWAAADWVNEMLFAQFVM